MKVAFAVGSFGGLNGSLLLLARPPAAIAIFAASLVGYVALFTGDYAYSVSKAIPGQLEVLIFVVAVAAALLGAGILASRRGSSELASAALEQASGSF